MKKRNFWAGLIIFLGFIAVLLWLYTKVVSIGNSLLTTTSIYLVYFYYVIVTIFLIYFIVRPFFIVFFSPSYSLKKIHSIESEKETGSVKKKHNYKMMSKMANQLIKKDLINNENKTALRVLINDSSLSFDDKYEKLRKLINKVIKDDLKGDIRKTIITTARDTLYFTAISQNGFADIVIVLINNFRLIKKIVKRCGFRPSYAKLFRFYIHVSISCFVADGAQSADIGSLLGGSIKGLAKPLIGSLIDGTINAFFMLRAGFLAMNLIFEEYEDEVKETNLLKNSFAQAAAALPELTSASFIEPIINVLKGTFTEPARRVVKRVLDRENPYADIDPLK